MVITERDEFGRIIKSIGREPTAFDLDKAIELYKGDKSINEVADELDISRSVVQRRFKKLGISKNKSWRNKGRKLSQEVKDKMSVAQKALNSNPEYLERTKNGKNNPFYGKHHKPETIEAMKVKLSVLMSGPNNPQWRGGVSFEPYHHNFKKVREWVYIRDNYTCQKCGIKHEPKSGKLVAHHKDANKMNSFMDNLITLCRPCHAIETQMWLERNNMVGKKGGKTHDN